MKHDNDIQDTVLADLIIKSLLLLVGIGFIILTILAI